MIYDKQGHILTNNHVVDGEPLSGDSDLQRILRGHKPGDTLSLSVIRGDQKLTDKVVLAEAPSP